MRDIVDLIRGPKKFIEGLPVSINTNLSGCGELSPFKNLVTSTDYACYTVFYHFDDPIL